MSGEEQPPETLAQPEQAALSSPTTPFFLRPLPLSGLLILAHSIVPGFIFIMIVGVFGLSREQAGVLAGPFGVVLYPFAAIVFLLGEKYLYLYPLGYLASCIVYGFGIAYWLNRRRMRRR